MSRTDWITKYKIAAGNCAITLGDLVADGCQINGNIYGNVKGNNNNITGGVFGNVEGSNNKTGGVSGNVKGNNNNITVNVSGAVVGDFNIIDNNASSIFGNSNRVGNNVTYCVKGNNNTILNNVGGSMTGTGNTARQVANFLGCQPHPYITPTPTPTRIPTPTPTSIPTATPTPTSVPTPTPTSVPTPTPTRTPTPTPTRVPTPTPTRPFGTCKDLIDNNQNELIDGGDPVCHTDGNQNNPNSYDPYRNEGPVSPTVTPTRTPTPTPGNPTATPTVPAGNTSINLNLFLHGIGKGGDSANPNSGGNPSPLHPQRNVTVEVYSTQNQLAATKQSRVTFNSATGNFTGTFDLGSTITTGFYTVKVKTTQFLVTLVTPEIQSLTQGTANQLPATVMVTGDIIPDNKLSILDYNILMGCYSDFEIAPSCTAANKLLSDLDDDGDVNQFDYNLFLREITNRTGQ